LKTTTWSSDRVLSLPLLDQVFTKKQTNAIYFVKQTNSDFSEFVRACYLARHSRQLSAVQRTARQQNVRCHLVHFFCRREKSAKTVRRFLVQNVSRAGDGTARAPGAEDVNLSLVILVLVLKLFFFVCFCFFAFN
jgi:hypothetical protein